jgi:purine nucleosidase
MPRQSRVLLVVLLSSLISTVAIAADRTKVIIDTDIGDDIDDAYALGLALSSPELEIIGVTTAWGATDLRAQLASRMLYETGRDDIPVVAGIKTGDQTFDQYGWAEWFHHPKIHQQNVVDFYTEQINRYPGQITLIAIGPLTNIGALIERAPNTFRKLKLVVIMGGNVTLTSYDVYSGTSPNPAPEYNIMKDVSAARKLFTSGVPIIMAGLDATTMLKLDEVKRARLFRKSSPLTDSITVLYHLWGNTTPTLFDPMAVFMVIDPTLTRLVPMHIEVDDNGVTRNIAGQPPNARVCFDPHVERFFDLFIQRLRSQNLHRPD